MYDYSLIVAVLLGQLFTSFITNYFIQKGKNLADKSDIKQLTISVEEVKAAFANEHEAFRSSLTLLSDKRSKAYSQEQQSLIQFYTNVNLWVWRNTNINFDNYNPIDIAKLRQFLFDLHNQYNETKVSFGVVDLLIAETDVAVQGQQLIDEVYKLQLMVQSTCERVIAQLHRIEIAQEMMPKPYTYPPTTEQTWRSGILKARMQQFVNTSMNFKTQYQTELEKAIEEMKKFRLVASKYLKA